ncbi:hypothetical protein H6G41_26710 [Tolypothrix sp. FACHB-123]|uniref:hypothetical protein n=1 Tax=Tolypothrix sp. FACHB-123 TaxID=2692868 RepID=UPI0016829C29|nr:hypothetical protein [Tolypothrix sp. FACHB-123]MBD2358160.1 hypothetical protein [Tolypothrix sp. FACHB-123]
MTKFQTKLQQASAVGISIAMFCSTLSRPVNANPAVILAPAAFCAGTAGVGCILIGTAVVGGVIYYVWQTKDGRNYAADANGQVNNSERLIGTTVFETREISGIEAAKLGNAHWVAGDFKQCYKMAKKNGWVVKDHRAAIGGGTWCIFEGKQTSFGSD